MKRLSMSQVQSYLGNPNVKRDGVVQEWSPELVTEYARCMKDPSYFARTYCKIISLIIIKFIKTL